MKARACSQTWKVEALRDGRLAGAEAQEFHRHAAACPVCEDLTRKLDDLGALLSALPVPERDAVGVRRDRQRLLEAADAQALGPAGRWRTGRFMLACVGVAAMAAIGTVALRRGSPDKRPIETMIPPAPIAAAPSSAAEPAALPRSFSVTVMQDAGARWTRQEDAHQVQIRLDEGTIGIAVAHGDGDKRLTFRVPDGEIEDLGTAFSVSVERAKTTHVVVTEGSIVLRLRGRDVVRLAAGESWERHVPGGDRAAHAARVRHEPRAGSDSDRGSSDTPGSTEELAAPAPSGCAEQSQWDEAMTDFQAGRYASAADRFGRFASNCAGDRRSEDATYLRVVALARAGRRDDARTAAQAYLNKFPNGFRRHESERFLRDVPPVAAP
jgi:hypothetical protein